MSQIHRTIPNGSLSQGNPSAFQYRRPGIQRVDRSCLSYGVVFNIHGDYKIDCNDERWDHITKVNSNLRGMRTKAWPFWEVWKVIFGKDRANGETAEDMVESRR
ncbi:hypothetical protein AAHA92_16873 [Salvia divinorum]|uniref:Uncharacterized protein n=1 Tax=Salvia divinorum TaxID=28513 RepID=A0ABD1GXG0_SALDI